MLAVDHLDGSAPGVLFCAGFHSNMHGLKANYLYEQCQRRGWAFTRFDYRGHGQSDGQAESTTLTDWFKDTLLVLDKVCRERQIIVGSSMGGWLAAQVTAQRPDRIHALVGIASAPDFTEALLWEQFSEAARARLRNGETWQMPSHYDDTSYPVSMALIESGRKLSVLRQKQPISCPVRLLHGLRDTDVPYTLSLRLLEQIESEDAQLILLKSADHRCSNPSELAMIDQMISQLRP